VQTSSLCFKIAVIFAIAGFAMGIGMAISHNHSIMPAHAHLALMGWVSMFLFGLYYRLHPSVDRRVLAYAQASTWALGTLILVIGVAQIYLGNVTGEKIAAVGSSIVLVALLMFAGLVFRGGAPTGAAESPDRAVP
jgi:cbb3-type cytochrome oxidase subunit 1